MKRLSIRDVLMPEPIDITTDYPEPASRVTERDLYEIPSDYEIRLRQNKETRPSGKPLSKTHTRFEEEQRMMGLTPAVLIDESIDGSPSSQMQSMQ